MLFLPPHSADFNPPCGDRLQSPVGQWIEQAFAKIKSILRKASARTVEALEAVIAFSLEAFSPDECANYFTNSGYEPDRAEIALDLQEYDRLLRVLGLYSRLHHHLASPSQNRQQLVVHSRCNGVLGSIPIPIPMAMR